MGLYKAQLSAGPFRRGEIVDIDEAEFARYIERGWLQKFDEGIMRGPFGQPLVAPEDLGVPDGGSAPSGEPESTETASDPTSDASPSDLPLADEATID